MANSPARHKSWRQAQSVDDKRRSRNYKRLFATLGVLSLLALFAYVLIRPLFIPLIHVVRLPFVEADLKGVPRIQFTHEDTQELKPLGEVGVKGDEKGDTSKFPYEIVNLQNSASLDTLTSRLQAFVQKSLGRSVLVLSISVHGISDNGQAYLLCSDFDPTKQATGIYPLRKFLDQLKDVQCDMKLVLLDAGRQPRDVRLGMVVNEFPRLLATEVAATGDPRLFVLSANSPLERSHVAPQFGQSVFGYYVAQGLMGWADLNDDSEVTLDELASFTRGNVEMFVKTETSSNESQTPYLIWGGGDPLGGDRTQLVIPVSHKAMAAQAKAYQEAEEADVKAKQEKKDEPGAEPKAAAHRSPTRNLAGMTLPAGLLAAGVYGPLAQADAKAEEKKEAAKAGEAKKADDAKAAEKKEPEKKEEPKEAAKKEEPKEEAKKEDAKGDPKSTKGPPPDTTAQGKLRAALRAAWELRDKFASRQERDGWGPVDYAPHLWREFEERLLGYELALRSGSSVDTIAANQTAEVAEYVQLLGDLLAGRELSKKDPGGSTSIAHRLREARPQFQAGVTDPRSLAMVERYGWKLGDKRPFELAAVAAEYDKLLDPEQFKLESEEERWERFAKFVAPAAAKEPNLVELRFASLLSAQRNVVSWRLAKKALEARRLAEKIAAQTRPYGAPTAALADWTPSWVKDRVEQADRQLLFAERILLAGRAASFAEAEQALDAARQDYNDAWSNVERIRATLQLVNDVNYSLRYYIRWHCAAGLMTPDGSRFGVNAPSAADIRQLYALAERLSKRRADVEPLDPSQLDIDVGTLREVKRRVEGALSSEVEALLAQPHLEGHIWRIQTLLSTPLPPAELRERLLTALFTKPQKSDRLHPVKIDLPAGDKLRSPTFGDWSQVFLQAGLELETVRLAAALSGKNQDLLKSEGEALYKAHQDFSRAPTDAALEDALWVAYRNLGAALRAFYSDLPVSLRKLDDQAKPYRETQDVNQLLERQRLLVRVDHGLRFVDARDGQVVERVHAGEELRTMDLYELVLWQSRRSQAAQSGAEQSERDYAQQAAKAYYTAAVALDSTTPPWQEAAAPSVAVIGPSSLKLAGEEQSTIDLDLRSEGDTRLSAWVVLDYDPEKLDVRFPADRVCLLQRQLSGEPEDLRPQPTVILAPGRKDTLKLTVKAKTADDAPTTLAVRVKGKAAGDSGGTYFTHRVEVSLPTPESIELLVAGTGGTFTREKDLVELRPFPNHPTDYRFDLRNATAKPRKVKVEFYSLASSDDPREESGTVPFDNNGFLLPNVKEPKLLGTAAAMDLPPGEPVPIAFPEPPKDAPAPPPPDPKAPPVETRPSVKAGLVMLIIDEANRQRIVKRIVVKPMRPSAYILPVVSYNFNAGRIEVTVKPKDDKKRLPAGGCEIFWDTEGEIPEGATMSVKGKVEGPDFETRLFVEIGPDPQKIINVKLHVDGCPRAFVYKVALSQAQVFQPEQDLQQIRIVAPAKEPPEFLTPAFKCPIDFIPVKFQVDVPVDAFRNPEDVIEVGIDRDKSSDFLGERPRRFFTDRMVDVLFDKAVSGGRVRVSTKVSDFEVKLPTEGLQNVEVGILGRLFLRGKQTWSDEGVGLTKAILDGTKPVIKPEEVRLRLSTIFVGQPVEMSVGPLDIHSGVKLVEAAFDPQGLGNFGAGKPVPGKREANEKWKIELPTEGLRPGRQVVLLRATDRVGIESDFVKTEVFLVAENNKAPGPTKQTRTVLVKVLFGDGKLEGATVDLNGSGKVAQTNSNGVCEFKDINPGRYEVKVNKTVKNKERNKLVPLMVEPPPPPPAPPAKAEEAPPVVVEVKLE